MYAGTLEYALSFIFDVYAKEHPNVDHELAIMKVYDDMLGIARAIDYGIIDIEEGPARV